MICIMRTTLDIDEDVLQSIKELAARRSTTAGRILSDLVRSALTAPKHAGKTRNGVPLLPRRKGAKLVTTEMVNRLRDEE
jgi:hypothetical protein